LSLKLIAILIGVIGAILGVYLREYIQTRNERLKSIKILRSNLNSFIGVVRGNEFLQNMMLAGFALDKRKRESLFSGDESDYKKLLNHLNELNDISKTGDLIADEHLDEVYKFIGKLSSQEVAVVSKELDRQVEDIEHGTGILGREDTRNLDYRMISRVLSIKRTMIGILINIKLVIVSIHTRDEVDKEFVKSLILSSIRSAIEACGHVIPLADQCDDATD